MYDLGHVTFFPQFLKKKFYSFKLWKCGNTFTGDSENTEQGYI